MLKHMEAVRSGAEPVPALVLMDINMPELNGFETIRELRSVSDFSKIPVIVMLTNSDSDQDLERSLEVGANGFQTKDFDIARYTEFFNSLAAE